MELDHQSLFGLYSLAETPQLSPFPAFGLTYEGTIVVSQGRRHIFVTPWVRYHFLHGKPDRGQKRNSWLFCLYVQVEYRVPDAFQAVEQETEPDDALRRAGVRGWRGQDLHPLLDDAEPHAGRGRAYSGSTVQYFYSSILPLDTDLDLDPDPVDFVIELQKANKKLI